MLLGINVLLRGPLLAALDLMGHGDLLVIADANFPARRLGSQVFDLPATTVSEAAEAVFSIFPIDVGEPVALMAPATGRAVAHDELTAMVSAKVGVRIDMVGRFEFYELAQQASVVISTGDTRPFGNLIAAKGGINL
jgi:L-fucose mutarotase